MPTAGQKEEVVTGWEEPSPESIRRRMEIDDGTAAWGDPGKPAEDQLQDANAAVKPDDDSNSDPFTGKYSGGAVNMWNRTGQSEQEAPGPPAQQHQPHPAHASMQQPMQHLSQDKGSGECLPSCLVVYLNAEVFETCRDTTQG